MDKRLKEEEKKFKEVKLLKKLVSNNISSQMKRKYFLMLD